MLSIQKSRLPLVGAVLLLLLSSCQSDRAVSAPPEAISLLGEPLFAPQVSDERRAALEAQLAEARADLAADPESEAAAIWVGRRLAYLGCYREAVAVYTSALEEHPASAELLRHRGHRYISLRQFEHAMDDLTRAAIRMRLRPDEVEADGQPNALGIPRGSLYTSVYYHLALAHYLLGSFPLAAENWQLCREFASNDDMRVAADYWLFLTLGRMGEHEQAAAILAEIHPEMDVIENFDYHRLLLHFAGKMSERDLLLPVEGGSISFPTTHYGLGAWALIRGDEDRADALFELVALDDAWAAFGHIAAEAELARMGG